MLLVLISIFYFICHICFMNVDGNNENSEIAICIAGEIRTFLLDDVQNSFKVSIIDQIKVDLFFQLSSSFTEKSRNFGMTLPNYSANSILSSLSKFNPVNLSLLSDADLEIHPLWINDHRYANHHLSYLTFRWGLCMDDIERNEKKRGIKYKFVIRLRPDIIWTCKLPSSRYYFLYHI